MNINRQIIVAVLGIAGISIARVFTSNAQAVAAAGGTAGSVTGAITGGTPVTPIIMGAYVVLLVLAVVDLFGPQAARIAGGLAMLALVYTILTQFPWTAIAAGLAGPVAAGQNAPAGPHGGKTVM